MSDRSSASALASALKGRGWGSSSQRLELHRLRQAEAEAKEAARGRRLTAALALLVILPGCAVTYVARAAYEEARILWRRQPIERVLAGDVDAATREKLELTLAVRAFAHATLGLSMGGSYTSLARVEHDQVVHIVSAAPRDRLVPYTWWFPIVGRVPYRGYFDPQAAAAEATCLEDDGYDTYVRPAVAFSTLGWFNDPLLSNMLRYDQVRLAQIIIHELLHSTIYIPGQGAFNESFATFVGFRGAIAFFASQGDTVRMRRAQALWEDSLTFSGFLAVVIARLERAYATGITPEDRRALFRALQDDYAEEHWQTNEYEKFAGRPLNNAIIVHQRLYADQLELFERAYAHNGRDLRASISWIREQANDEKDPFAAVRNALPQLSAH